MMDADHSERRPQSCTQVPIWYAPFNTNEFHKAEIGQVDENQLVLWTNAPIRPGTILFTRYRADSGARGLQHLCPAVRNAGVVEVKWCRAAGADDRDSVYAMGVQYFKTY
jgi:hypothetical protein